MKILKYFFLFISVLILTISLAYLALIIQPSSESDALNNDINSYFANVNGIRLHYIEIEKGPLIILLHG